LRLGGAGGAVGAFPAAAVVCTEALSGGQRLALSTLQDEVGFGSCGLAERVGRSALFRPPLWCVPTALSGGQRIALSTLRDYDSVQRPRRGLDRPTPPSPRPGVGSGNVGLGRAVGVFPAAAAVCTEALSTLRDEVGFGRCGLAGRVGRSALFRPPLWCVPRRCPVDNALRCPPYKTRSGLEVAA